MHSFMLEDWLTIRGIASSTTVQSEDQWLDLSPYQDLLVWVDCREFTGTTPQISIQTAPTKDESLMTTCIGPNNLTTSGVQVYKLLLSQNPTVPLGRWVRWSITGPAAAWDATLRILVSANSPGMQ